MSKEKPIKLSTPRMRVTIGDPDDPDTWEQLEVQNIGRDMLLAETLFNRRKWGQTGDSPGRLGAVSCYYALLRTKQLKPDTSWDEFEAMYIDVDQVVEEQADPTVPEPETD